MMTTIRKEIPELQPLATFKAPPGTGYIEPSTFTLVRAESPALAVMTDLKQVTVATTGPDATLAQATQTMISRGVRLLLVVDRDDIVLGLITSRDTLGEKPIKLIKAQGGKHSDLLVSDLMCPRDDIDLVSINDVLHATVGDIVATLKNLKRQHALVGERNPITKQTRIRGIFSATQIGRQLGAAVQTFEVSTTFSEIEGLLSQDNI
ncbi:MAG: CBS domain-containing protein [Rhodocyclaceae bacterium]|nr:CBS domain-containing protein [Rhodocyclaceae bacterium]MDP3030453.1 CBS domain-containing protein [Rhodocyclaceae bacterium]